MKEKLDDLRLRKARSERIKRAYEIEGVQEALELTEKKWTEAWKNTERHDKEGRELAWAGIQSIQMMKQYYLSIIADGKAATAEERALERRMKG